MCCVFSSSVRDKMHARSDEKTVSPSPHNILAISSIPMHAIQQKSSSCAQLTYDDITYNPPRAPNQFHAPHDKSTIPLRERV